MATPAGAASSPARAPESARRRTRILVDLGAEVHAVDTRKPDVPAIASYSETDLQDPDAIARTIGAIGAVVNNLFNCAGGSSDVVREVTERVIPNMIDGAAISSLAGPEDTSEDLIARYTASRAVELVELGIRINCLRSANAEAAAWPLVLLGSPRSSPVTGATL